MGVLPDEKNQKHNGEDSRHHGHDHGAKGVFQKELVSEPEVFQVGLKNPKAYKTLAKKIGLVLLTQGLKESILYTLYSIVYHILTLKARNVDCTVYFGDG